MLNQTHQMPGLNTLSCLFRPAPKPIRWSGRIQGVGVVCLIDFVTQKDAQSLNYLRVTNPFEMKRPIHAGSQCQRCA